MRRKWFAVVALAGFAVLPATSMAQVGYGLAAGLSTPEGDFTRIAHPGYHLTGLVTFSPPLAPVGFRGEASISRFRDKFGSATTQILSATANAVFAAPSLVGLYFIGGIGIYNASAICNGCTSNSTRGGINVGGGFKFGLGGLEAFLEARYHYIPGPMDATTGGIKSSTRFIPVSFGLKF